MNMSLRVPDDAAISRLNRDASDEVIKRIRKLRWIGMEEEAEVLEQQLRCVPTVGKAGVLAGPYSTD